MKLKCIRAFGFHKPGDHAEVPDGAAFDPHHYEPVTAPPAPLDPPAPPAPGPFPAAPKEM